MKRNRLMHILAAVACAAALSSSYVYGIYSHMNRLFPYPQLLAIKNRLFPLSIGFKDTSMKTVVPCAAAGSGRTMVALALGQSNTGNHGETLHRSLRPVINLYRGRCYRAEDPLLGPTGDRGSVWTRLGDLLIGAGLYDRVIIIPIGVGSTAIADWVPGGYLHRRVTNAIEEARRAGLAITHVFWIQGGSEKRSNGDAAVRERYKKDFRSLVRSLRDRGVTAPAYVAIGTIGMDGFKPDIARAQRELVDPAAGILAGPDTDSLHAVEENRWEVVHFSPLGLDRCARAWLDIIRKSGSGAVVPGP
ncbi:MAG TPA: sialate O-acetylesterase [Spirochaetota bacterium]|nr:hypothetical protein [Spirochaetota bacterium]HOD14591.1 sialate O-acetylesterase [Spirochaetota bacterium]HPG50119.1 sialate O-acetylesterase [Spirochaetota bacterium]HPN14244.1 sialate O-acetylesterase [Spirochaetota bacterium]HQL80680.1 sialate O-acetylesterase [Spirochaetota bacterium]